MRERKSMTKGWSDGRESRSRRVAKRRTELPRGKCGLTGKPCEEERWCEYGSSSVREGAGPSAKRKIVACAVAIGRGYNSCRQCQDQTRCGEVWRCFRKESPAKELLAEPGRLRRNLDRPVEGAW